MVSHKKHDDENSPEPTEPGVSSQPSQQASTHVRRSGDSSRDTGGVSGGNAIDEAVADKTHPLPTDVTGQPDSTGGNAPFAPADITPAGPDDDGTD